MRFISSVIPFSIVTIIAIGTCIYVVSTIHAADLFPIALAPSPTYIALTFDDGPYGTPTNQILDILKEKNVKATFFVVGKNVEKYPEIAIRELVEGHVVGNHSYDHAHMGEYSADQLDTNLQKSEKVIVQTIGVAPALFRAPYGMTSPTMITDLSEEKFTYVGWNEDPDDWDFTDQPSDKVLKDVLQHARPDGVIILHDGRDVQVNYPRSNTISALPYIIDHLRNRGYTFITVDTMLNIAPYKN